MLPSDILRHSSSRLSTYIAVAGPTILYLLYRVVLEIEEQFSNKPAETEIPYQGTLNLALLSRWLTVSCALVLSSLTPKNP